MEDSQDGEIRRTIPNLSMIFNSSPNFAQLPENEKSYLEQASNLFQAMVFT